MDVLVIWVHDSIDLSSLLQSFHLLLEDDFIVLGSFYLYLQYKQVSKVLEYSSTYRYVRVPYVRAANFHSNAIITR